MRAGSEGGRTDLSINDEEGGAAEHGGALVRDHPQNTRPQQQHEGEPAVVCDAPRLSHTHTKTTAINK